MADISSRDFNFILGFGFGEVNKPTETQPSKFSTT